MKNAFTLFSVRKIRVFLITLALSVFITGCASEAQPVNMNVKWYEGTWKHEDGKLRLSISGTGWTLLYLGVNDEKGTIRFNENSQVFTMKPTHHWDKDTGTWGESDEAKKTANYNVSGDTWTVNNHAWIGFNGKWTKTAGRGD